MNIYELEIPMSQNSDLAAWPGFVSAADYPAHFIPVRGEFGAVENVVIFNNWRAPKFSGSLTELRKLARSGDLNPAPERHLEQRACFYCGTAFRAMSCSCEGSD